MEHPAAPGPAPQASTHLEPATNDLAVWSWAVAVVAPVVGLVLGIVALARSRRRGGAGRTSAVVGVALSGTALAVQVVVGVLVLVLGAGVVLGLLQGGAGSRGLDDSVTSVTDAEQTYLDGLYEDTWESYQDADLLAMGHGVCDDLEGGADYTTAGTDLLEGWDGATSDVVYDVTWEATHDLCPAYGEGFEDLQQGDGDGDGDQRT